MKLINLLVLALMPLYLFNCSGSNPAEEGLKAFQSANYSMAIKLLLDARKEQGSNDAQDEKISLAFMHRGEDLFNKTKNIKSFSGNFEKALKYLPQNASLDFKQNYSRMLYSLGHAYLNGRAQNELQAEEYLEQAIHHLEAALLQDSTNTEAKNLLSQINQDNYQKWLTKGKRYYDKARSKRDLDMYFLAEYYVKKAADFKKDDEEVRKLHSRIKEKTLSVLNYRDDLALAVADIHSHEGKIFLDVTVKNYLVEPVALNVNNFTLVDKTGHSYSMDKKMMMEVFTDRSLKNTQLNEDKSYVDGLLIFKVPQKSSIDYLAYHIDDSKVSKKYFP